MDRELRRQQNTLGIAGTASIAFGVWTAVRTIMFFTTEKSFYDEISLEAVNIGFPLKVVYVFFFAVVAIYLVIELSSRLYVGLRARSESQGRQRSIRYIVVAAIILLSQMQIWFTMAKGFDPANQSLISLLFTLLIELSSIFAMLELVVSALRIRLIRRRMQEG